MAVTLLLSKVALDALLIVLKIGPGPLEQGEVFIALLLGGRDPVPQRLQVSQDGRSRLVFRHLPGRRFAGSGASSRVLTSLPTPLKTWWVLIILSSCGHASLRLIRRARLRNGAVLRLSRKRNAELPLEMMFQPERAQGPAVRR